MKGKGIFLGQKLEVIGYCGGNSLVCVWLGRGSYILRGDKEEWMKNPVDP